MMKQELRRDLQDYGILLVFLTFMLIGMVKCAKYTDGLAARYNSNQDRELSQLKQQYKKHYKK